MSERIYNKTVALNKQGVRDFFQNRVDGVNERHDLAAVSYQDNNPGLARARHDNEMKQILPLLDVSTSTKVLDIGCGIGRWAEAFVGKVDFYHGTDLIPGMIDIANERYRDKDKFTFQVLPGDLNTAQLLENSGPFSLFIISGVALYMDEDECRDMYKNVLTCCSTNCRVYVREPLAISERLTLNEVWSEELQTHYSAIYRSYAEHMAMLHDIFEDAGFYVPEMKELYDDDLANRRETRQFFTIVER